jgi:thioredoxin 1
LDELEEIRLRKMRDLMAKNISDADSVDTPMAVADSTFEGFVKSKPVVVIDCWAEWCGPCGMIAPVIEQLAKEFAGKVTFGKLNVDENPATASRYRITSIPTLLVMKNGVLVDTITGAVPKEYIATKLKSYV